MASRWPALGLAALLWSADARADCASCLTSDALWPLPGPQRFAYVPTPELPPPGRFSVALVSTWQTRPITLHVPTPGPPGTDVAVIEDQVESTLVAAFGIIDRLAAFVALPATLYETGRVTSSGFHDPRAGVALAIVPRLALFGEVQVQDKGVVLTPTIAGDLRFRGRFVVAGALGGRIRPVTATFLGARQTTQALASAAAGVDIIPHLGAGLEARALVDTHLVFGGEWLASVRSAFFSDSLTLLAGGGGTLPLGGPVGIGELRVVVGVAYAPAPAATK